MDNQKIIDAVKKLYYSAHWSPDRDCGDADKLWTDVKDACGFSNSIDWCNIRTEDNSAIEIKGEWEDLIYDKQKFIQELQKVQDKYYDDLVKELKKDGFPDELEEWLFDFVFNCDEELDGLEEYLNISKNGET